MKPVPPRVLAVLAEAVEAYQQLDAELRKNLNPDSPAAGKRFISPKGAQAILESRQARAEVTAESFLAELAEADMTVADWAREQKQPLGIVYQLLQGRVKGTRGNARKVARAMGLALPAVTPTATAA